MFLFYGNEQQSFSAEFAPWQVEAITAIDHYQFTISPRIATAAPKPRTYAIPVKIVLFPTRPSDIEKRKTDYLKTVVSVRAIAGGR